jgi:two-component system chemotaxis response regulator CheB
MLNLERISRDIVVIGASAGGVEAVRSLVAQFPRDLPAAVAIVIHRSPVFESRLPFVLGRYSKLPVSEPLEAQPVTPGHIYTAPRDQHLVFEGGKIAVNRGPKEHRTRPAIDPLFRSAARHYGPRVVGVLLTGLGDDGVPGFIEIKSAGGLSMVQDPAQALHKTMPTSAIVEDDVDAVLMIDDLAKAIITLANGETYDPPRTALVVDPIPR